MIIQNTNDLVKFINDIGTPPYVAVDTEFISEKSYYPQLCLAQVAYGSKAAVIDTLSEIDLEPLIKFLKDPQIVKVFHSADQDLAILWNNFRLAPTPVFDTQIAAMVCGFGEQVSYGQLVKAFTKTNLDKSSQCIDWSKRPLLGYHFEYALADVVNLCPVYERLCKDIDKRDRASWIEEEMRELSNPKRYEFNPVVQSRRLKVKRLTPRRLATLHGLVCWREEQAKSRNIPRGWALKDLTLCDIVSNPPRNIKDLERVRGIGNNARGQAGREILQSIRSSEALPLSECPPIDPVNTDEQANENTVVLLRALLKHVCEINEVAPKLVAKKSELEQIALGGATRTASGWRWKLFGELAGKLLKGQIALTLTDGEIEIVKTN